MLKPLILALIATGAIGAQAATLVDTGTPNGEFVGAEVIDSSQSIAGEFSLAAATSLSSISAHLLGGAAGETFTISLYDDAASAPGSLLFSTTATYGADGWNGASGLGWNLAAGNYWVGFEVGANDTLGNDSGIGGLLDVGAPNPLLHTAVNQGDGYQTTDQPISFGLRVDSVSAVPEPASMALMFAGLGLVGLTLRRRRG